MTAITLEAVEAMDARDPLASLRDRFEMPEGRIYLDGNSLGAMPRETASRVQTCIAEHWGKDLILSWNRHDWIGLSRRIGEKLAPIIGARRDEVIACDSTSINLYKLISAALADLPANRRVLTEESGFPTNRYMLDARARDRVVVAPRGAILDHIDDSVALVALTHVDYRSGDMLDLAKVTTAAREAGALVLWDLSHSAGAVRVDLDASGADLAVGCGYKYLNGGPGAPAWLYVRRSLQDRLQSPLPGWLGHARPFDFEQAYEGNPGVDRFLCGTPPIIAMTALECGIDQFSGVEIERLFEKGRQLGALYIELMEQMCGDQGFTLVSPRDDTSRGCHVSYSHEHAYAICQALIERGVIGDFRTPDILRMGFAALYTRFADVWHAVSCLREIMATKAWDEARFKVRNRVT